jgi:hypothetical protein
MLTATFSFEVSFLLLVQFLSVNWLYSYGDKSYTGTERESVCFTYCTCSLFVSWARQTKSVQWLCKPNLWQYSWVGHITDLTVVQLVAYKKRHTNLIEFYCL